MDLIRKPWNILTEMINQWMTGCFGVILRQDHFHDCLRTYRRMLLEFSSRCFTSRRLLTKIRTATVNNCNFPHQLQWSWGIKALNLTLANKKWMKHTCTDTRRQCIRVVSQNHPLAPSKVFELLMVLDLPFTERLWPVYPLAGWHTLLT